MKKVLRNALIVLLAMVMLFSLTGCGKKEDSKQGEEQKTEFSIGEWKDNVYTNDFLGLKFNLPEGWTYSSKEEIADMMNLGYEILNDDQKAAVEVSKLNSAYYMVANDPDTANNIAIMSEKVTLDVTTEYYINQLKTQLSSVSSIKYQIDGVSKEKVGNIECDTLTASATMYGVKVSQKYYVYKIDKYFVAIIATSRTGETGINEMMQNFQ